MANHEPGHSVPSNETTESDPNATVETNETSSTNETNAVNAPTGPNSSAVGNESNATNSTNESNESGGDGQQVFPDGRSSTAYGPGSSGNSGDGDDDDGGLFPSPAEQMSSIVEWIEGSMDDDVTRVTELMDEAIVGIATSAEFHPDSWISPDDGKWPVFHRFVLATLPLTCVALFYHGFGIFMVPTRQQQEEILKETLYYGGMVAAGYLLLGGYFHLLDATATAISPGGTEFFNSTEGRAQLALSGLGALIVTSLNFGLTLVVAIIMYAMHESPYYIYAAWNLSWAMKCMPSDKLQALGDLVPTVAVMLAPARIGAAVLLLLASWLMENASTAAEYLDAQINIWIILIVVGFGIPWTFWRSYGVFAGMLMSKSAIAKANRSASAATSTLNSPLSRGLGIAGSRAERSAKSAKRGVVKTASNAKRRAASRVGDVRETAMSKAGGAVLTAKHGRDEFPRHQAARNSPRRKMESVNRDSASSTESARSKAKSRERRDASVRADRAKKNANQRSDD